MALHIDKAFEGVSKNDLDFLYGSGTFALFGCVVTLREEFTYLRGYDNHFTEIISDAKYGSKPLKSFSFHIQR